MRFVVLHHTGWPGKPDHYDLLLQFAEGASDDDLVLRAFATVRDEFPLPGACTAGQASSGTGACRLRLQADHRRAYLTFQGAVSGGRGGVERVDEGACEMLAPRATEPEDMCVRLAGARLKGCFRLRRVEASTYAFESTGESRR
jgi:hypothetical protein